MLEKINNSKDLKKLNIKEKEELAQDIRNYLVEVVSNTGGHLASNLGVVELTIALESIFNLPDDKIIWDVGHQTYVHKILNGRKEQLKNMRTLNGIAGFPKTEESETDCFNTGHSSTSISAAMGMAKARDIKGEKNSVVAVIGDGALTGGMALEALNHVGSSKTKMIVVLNDNEMSISKNIGGINMFLSKLRARKMYNKSNVSGKRIISKIPFIGKYIVKIIQKLKRGIKQLIIPKMYFEDIGFKYLGPIDGHNIEDLEFLLAKAKELDEPVLMHVLTKKGKGYKPAEENSDKFHATGSFFIEDGKPKKEKKIDYSAVFGKKICELAEKNEKIVAITAAMKDGTGLTEFALKFPNRFFDVGIAEQHAITFAAGLAKEGMIPFIPIYSSFYQRAYDQVIHDVAMQNLHVIMCVDRAGIVGADGETHQGILDLSFFKLVPNLKIFAPKDFKEFEQMLEYAVYANGPIVIRYPRGGEDKFEFYKENKKAKESNIKNINNEDFQNVEKAEVLQEGKDVTIIGIGKTVAKAMKIAEKLEEKDIKAEVINARCLKPFDKETIINSINKTKFVVTIEDNSLVGGLGSSVKEVLVDNCKKENLENIKIKTFGYNDIFVKHGKVEEIENKYGVDEENIFKYIENKINNEKE